ncbi:MAG: hypothetical protein ACLFTA_00785 [Candidatus Nanohaloarchaea archaeon]
MIEYAALNSFLDVAVKVTAVALGMYLLFLLRNLNSFVQEAEESVKSVEESAQAVEKSVKWGRFLPFIGGKE